MSQTETPDDVYTDEDMALVGRSLMESLRISCPKWSPADDPAEIVVDLLNVIHDLKERFREIKAMTPAHYAREHALIDEALTWGID